MDKYYDETRFSFHDANILELSQQGQVLRLALEAVTFDTEQTTASVIISGVEEITRDGNTVSDVIAETEDGDVIEISGSDDGITLIVRWHKYQPKSHVTCVYVLSGRDIGMEVEIDESGVPGGVEEPQ